MKDANGNVATNFGGSVTFSQTTGSGSLTGLGSVNAVSGVATISLTGNAAGSVTIKATASSIDSNTLTFNVIAGALNKFAIANISSPQTAGSAFGITITAQDANSNTVPSFTNTVNLSTTAGAITPTVSGAFAAGVRTENVTVTQAGLGKTITATRTGGGETGTSNTFDVNAGALAKFAISNISTQTAAVAFSVTITAQDANNNTVTGFTSTVDLSTNAGTISPVVSGAFVSGVRTESAVSVTLAGTGKTITAKRTGGSETGTSNSFTVNAGALNHFAVEAAGGGNIGSHTVGVASISREQRKTWPTIPSPAMMPTATRHKSPPAGLCRQVAD